MSAKKAPAGVPSVVSVVGGTSPSQVSVQVIKSPSSAKVGFDGLLSMRWLLRRNRGNGRPTTRTTNKKMASASYAQDLVTAAPERDSNCGHRSPMKVSYFEGKESRALFCVQQVVQGRRVISVLFSLLFRPVTVSTTLIAC